MLCAGPAPGVDFFRPGAFFAVIADGFADEDDGSLFGAGNHDPFWYESFFEASFQSPFLFSWNDLSAFSSQAVTGTGLASVLDLTPGIGQMVSDTNGVAIDTTGPQWPTAALASVWTSAITANTHYFLTGKPSQGQAGIVVTVNGTTLSELAAPGGPPQLDPTQANPCCDRLQPQRLFTRDRRRHRGHLSDRLRVESRPQFRPALTRRLRAPSFGWRRDLLFEHQIPKEHPHDFDRDQAARAA